ncbi:MAG: hypothetical protein WCO45_08845 [Pseudanabaena sp. ELA607]
MTPDSPQPQKTKQREVKPKRLGMGFRQPQATMREFVILLIFLLGNYVALHLFIPSNSSLSYFKIKNDKIRSPILQEIALMKNELSSQENRLLAQPNPTPITKNPQTDQSQTNSEQSSLSLKSSNGNSLLTLKTIEKWRDNFGKSNISKKEERYLTDLSSDLSALLNEIESKDIKKERISILLLNINKSLANLELSLEDSLEQSLFWTGNGKWLEVILWSLFGTLLYIIQQTSEYYLSSNQLSSGGNRVLIRRKPQYYYFLFQSPFTALVILWILSMANLNIAGISLALSSAPSEVLISLAFILGLYNRVANTQLNLIVASIFGDAWKKTVRKIEIQKHDGSSNQSDDLDSNKDEKIEVHYGQCIDFDVLPDVKVKWSIISTPSVGIINPSTGTYIAPPEGFYYNENKQLKEVLSKSAQNSSEQTKDSPHNTNYTQDIIQAVREDEESVSALALVILKAAPPDKSAHTPSVNQDIAINNDDNIIR